MNILYHFKWSPLAQKVFKFHTRVKKCHFGNFPEIGWNGHALLVQPSISAHRKWKWSTFCGSYEFLACLECWIISTYSFGVGSGIKTVCHGFMPPQLKTNFLNYKFFEQILNSWPMCGTAVGGQAAAKKWPESGEMYKKATVLLYTRLHWTATIKVNTALRLQAELVKQNLVFTASLWEKVY